ncbi:hypothetical protein, partial [Clostridium botulinum]|uniref:hypothetical protein n=2 Tax=Clostridium botulinum TaxID=1491 RepID=UPI000AB800F2
FENKYKSFDKMLNFGIWSDKMNIRKWTGYKKVYKLKVKNKGEEIMENVVERYCTVSESLEESLKQMKAIRSGKMKKKTWKEFKQELQEEDSN